MCLSCNTPHSSPNLTSPFSGGFLKESYERTDSHYAVISDAQEISEAQAVIAIHNRPSSSQECVEVSLSNQASGNPVGQTRPKGEKARPQV